MADWKLSYNYNSAYHAYAYSFLYPPGADQSGGNMACWGETQATDLSGYNSPGFYAAAAPRPPDESPPDSPEEGDVNGCGHYQASGQAFQGRQHGSAYSPEEVGRSGSDSEVHASPDSWSSASSGEGTVQLPDMSSWTRKRNDDEASITSSSSCSPETRQIPNSVPLAPQTFTPNSDHEAAVNDVNPPQEPTPQKKKGKSSAQASKAKARVAFTESQMNTLGQCFSVQRYLTPAEMKNIAELTGLTYKQVKTWFQNRRMKLKRHQKDSGWSANKEGPVRGTVIASVHNPLQNYQGDVKQEHKTHFNENLMSSMPVHQNMARYLSAMGNTSAPPGYPSWPMGSHQPGATPKPQTSAWHMAPGLHHFDHTHGAYSANDHFPHEMSKTTEPVSSHCV